MAIKIFSERSEAYTVLKILISNGKKYCKDYGCHIYYKLTWVTYMSTNQNQTFKHVGSD